MPQPLFDDELLTLPQIEKEQLLSSGLEVIELGGEAVARAAKYFNSHRPLHLNDCFALALAEDIEDAILLTGDSALRRISKGKGVEVRGILWVTDELEARGTVALKSIYDALYYLEQDPLVFLPHQEVRRRMQ
jgi:hypothetical protein